MIAPDVYNRVCIWQPSSGFVADLYRNDFKRAVTPVITKGYFEGADGSDYDVSKEWSKDAS